MRIYLGVAVAVLALWLPTVASAIPMTLYIEGSVYDSRDDFNIFGLGTGDDTIVGATVTATYHFDTDNAGTNSSSDPTYARYDPSTNWITSTISIDTSTVDSSFGDGGPVTDADYFDDQVIISDDYDGLIDQYEVYDFSGDLSSSPFEHFSSSAYISSDPANGLITSFDLDQILTLGMAEIGFGSLQYTVSPATSWAYYRLTAFDLAPSSVPEPSVLALMGIGLAGIGFAKRKKA